MCVLSKMNFNVVDVYKGISERKRKRKESYKHVLKLCQKQIRKVADKDGLKCVFAVPNFIVGIPLFDLADCTAFVKQELEKAGFAIEYYYPNFLFISWDVEDLEKNTNISPMTLEFKSEKDEPDKNMIMHDRANGRFLKEKIVDERSVGKKFVLNLG